MLGGLVKKVGYPPQLRTESLPQGCVPEFTWPEELGFELPDEVNLTEWVLDRNLTADRADRVAFYSGDGAITYRMLCERVNKFANALRDLGIGAGDRVMLRIPNGIEFIVGALATARLGGVVVPTMTLLRARALVHEANTCQAKVIVSAHELLEEIEIGRGEFRTVEHVVSIGGDPEELSTRGQLGYGALLAAADDHLESVRLPPWESLGSLFFTSGTTGMPKGCMHLLGSMIGSLHLKALMLGGVLPTDVFIGSPPFAFVIGFNQNVLLPLVSGVPSVILEGRMSVERLVEAIPTYKATVLNAVPTAFNQLLDLPDIEHCDLSSLRMVVSGSAPLSASTFYRFKELTGLEIVNGIGSTELNGTCVISRPGDDPEASGRPAPGVEAKIVDQEGNECPPGGIGRLASRSCFGTMYWDNVEQQKEAVVDGWSLSGDFFKKDGDGLFWYVSRVDDIIKSRGYRVAPGEVEDALGEHEAVREAAVIGVPDAEQGQRVKAFVVLKAGFEGSPLLVEELRAFVKKRVAPYMSPSDIEFAQSLPKTGTGKIRRVELRELEAGREADRRTRSGGEEKMP
jgi:2-aminobenzoate-CoA ligase